MIRKFRKKPITVKAIQFNGENQEEIIDFTKGKASRGFGYNTIVIETIEGNMVADLGDWIIEGVAGEFYPCKPQIFGLTYEWVKE